MDRSGCNDCPAGRYRDDLTTDWQCKACPSGWKAAYGRKMCEQCARDGTIVNSDNSACKQCRGGQFANTELNECVECPLHGVTRCEGGFVEPENGFWAGG